MTYVAASMQQGKVGKLNFVNDDFVVVTDNSCIFWTNSSNLSWDFRVKLNILQLLRLSSCHLEVFLSLQ